MTKDEQKSLGSVLWDIGIQLRGSMNANDFRDYMLTFLFLRYLSDNYEAIAKKELGADWPVLWIDDCHSPLAAWYQQHPEDIEQFESMMRRKARYVIRPEFLWGSLAEMARAHSSRLLKVVQDILSFIEAEVFGGKLRGLFSEVDFSSKKLGKDYDERNERVCEIVDIIDKGLSGFSAERDTLGDAYEYLIDQFASKSGRKTGEFYTPQPISSILSGIVSLDAQDPASGKREKLANVLDFACGSGSLLLNVRRRMGSGNIGKLYGQEKNITTYNLARMNMLLHGLKDMEFEIFHGDTLLNEWPLLREENPAKKIEFAAVVANPPFSFRWKPSEEMVGDFRFKDYGLAPKSAADFAFLLHGFHYLHKEGTMAIILPHGVLFRGNVEAKIRRKLLLDGNIDTVIGLAPNLFYSTGIPVCILVLKKCKKFDDLLFINAAELYEKGKRQNRLLPEHVDKIIDTYRFRREVKEELPNGTLFVSRRVSMEEIEENDFNLNITRYVSTAKPEPEVDLMQVHTELVELTRKIDAAKARHNVFLRELGLSELP